MGTTPAQARLPTGQPKVGAEGCRIAADCGGVDLAALAVGLLWTLAFCLLVLGSLGQLRQAREVLREELARTRAERDAFAGLARRVSKLGTASPAGGSSAGGAAPTTMAGATAAQSVSGGCRDRVRDAYRETVMAVGHYESEYGEPFAESLAAEFGDELAAVVDSDPPMTPQLKAALIESCSQAREERETFLSALEKEEQALDDAGAAIAAFEEELRELRERPLERQSFGDLLSAWDRTQELEGDCRDLLEERQRTVHGDPTFSRWRDELGSFHDYLYAPLDVTYPVLADGTATLDEISAFGDDVVDALARRG